MTLYRFFLDVIDAQEIWLNALSDRGYRLVEVKGCKYTFEKCESSEYVYMVDAVAVPSATTILERETLLDTHKLRILHNKMLFMGNTVFLICEKRLDNEPLEISSTPKDAIICYKKIRNLAIVMGIIFFLLTFISLTTDFLANAPMMKIILAGIVFWFTSTGFKATQIISDYIVRYKLSEPL